MSKIPTAEEYAHTQYLKRREAVKPGQLYPEPPSTEQINDMIEFARLHIESALEEASKKAEIDFTDSDGVTLDTPKVDEKSILNSYPLLNVK